MKSWYLVVACLLGGMGGIGVGSGGMVWAQTSPAPEKQSTVSVVITSDEQTWVSVTNVRQPAKFKSLRLQLPPGQYEIVGRRRGYRDESRTLVLREGMPPVTLSVVCTVNSGG
jgi:hypothetical protein